MPVFDNRRPPEPGEPDGPRIVLFVRNLRAWLMADWYRAAWVGVGILFLLVVVIPFLLLLYSYGSPGDQPPVAKQVDEPQTVTCDMEHLIEADACIAPRGDSIECEAESRDSVVLASREEGFCQERSERPKDCAAFVYETDECIPYADTIMCDSFTAGKVGTCSPSTEDDAVPCYKYYYDTDYGECIRAPYSKSTTSSMDVFNELQKE